MKLDEPMSWARDSINKAFRKEALKLHPDKIGGVAEPFQKLNNAKEKYQNS